MEAIHVLEPPERDAERDAFIRLDPEGFYIRHPPFPDRLDTFITPNDQVFQTSHMGAAVVDHDRWRLIVDGLVERPFALSLDLLHRLPSRTITSFHECFGSPLKPATTALWRVGNVQWTGVPLNTLLEYARLLPQAQYVWSEGLDRGQFSTVTADRYQKDLPLEKALSGEVLLAYKINGRPLSNEQGAPVRLIVPGWFGTNSTKWICRLSLQAERAPGPYTTTLYNVPDPASGVKRPVWQVEPNSMIVRPAPDAKESSPVQVEGWAWCEKGITTVEVTVDGGASWVHAEVSPRVDFSWQRYCRTLRLEPGHYMITARATSKDGVRQSLSARRNQCHSIAFHVMTEGQ